ncbi:hypothetical protein Sjap_001424 [Stephania japonica]|uniref:Uncharacterized protein n=1 Tax=Stephania japonica TaxID=461633 RepID=A0AAP0KM80_9MAGN
MGEKQVWKSQTYASRRHLSGVGTMTHNFCVISWNDSPLVLLERRLRETHFIFYEHYKIHTRSGSKSQGKAGQEISSQEDSAKKNKATVPLTYE